MEKKKIAFFIPTIDIGGVEINTLNLSYSIKNQFGKPLLIYLREKNTELKREFSETMALVKMKNRRSIFLFLSFKEMIRREKPEIIVISSFINLIHLTLLKKFFHSDLKIIFKVETNLERDLRNQSVIDLILFKLFKNFSLKLCDLVVCSCNSLQQSFLRTVKIEPHKLKTIYNPVVKNEHLNSNYKSAEHRFFNELNPDRKVFISIGRLVESKGFSELIKTFKKYISIKEDQDAKLLIVGIGPLLDQLNQLIESLNIEDSVEIIPFNNSFVRFIQSSDVFVSNSSYEGLNNNIVHALSQGKKIIATDCEFGPREVLLDGKLGTLIQPGNQDALLNAIQNIFENQGVSQERLIERSKDFSIDKISEKFISMIDSV